MQVALGEIGGVQVTLGNKGGVQVALGNKGGMQVALGEVRGVSSLSSLSVAASPLPSHPLLRSITALPSGPRPPGSGLLSVYPPVFP